MIINVKKIITMLTDKIDLFEEETGRRPKYIKMPLWTFNLLNEHFNKLITTCTFDKDDDDTAYYFYGVIVCETDTISLLSQIEVF